MLLFVCSMVGIVLFAQDGFTVIESSGIIPVGTAFNHNRSLEHRTHFTVDGNPCFREVSFGGIYCSDNGYSFLCGYSRCYSYRVEKIGNTVITNTTPINGGKGFCIERNGTQILWIKAQYDGNKYHLTNGTDFVLIQNK